MSDIEVSQHGMVRRLRLNRPDRLNAMSPTMFDELFDLVDDAAADPGTSVIVLSGAGRAFCAGADMKAAAAAAEQNPGAVDLSNAPGDMIANRARIDRYLRLWSCPKPLIAQVHGYCIGMANEIVGAADLVVCGESAQIGMPEARSIGLPPTLGLWPMRLGMARTKELLFTGRFLTGAEAVALGLAIAMHPDEHLEAEVDRLAAHIAETPVALLSVTKQAVNSWAEHANLRAAALGGAEYHAIFHQASAWHQAIAES